MSEEKKRVPKLRFPGFEDEWEQRKLGELTSLITKGTTPLDKSNNGTVNFVKIESIDNSSGEITITQKISSEEHEGYLRRSQLKENDILFSIAGTLGRVTSVKSSVLPANTNQALAIIRLKNGCLKYVKTYLKGKAVADFIKKNPTIGAQPNLSLEQVSNLEIALPTEQEQEAIGSYFDHLDHLITLHQHKLERLKQVKKGLLQKMFPKEGEKIPEIRFPGFTENWEQRKLGEIGTIQTCKRIFKEQTSEVGDIPFYKNGTIGLKADAFISREIFEEYKELYPFPEVGDILISAVGSIGRTAEYTGKDEYFQDSNVVWLKTDDKINKKFLKVSYQVIKWLIEGSTVKHLYNDNILKSEIIVPKSQKEQGRIGDYFETLDHLITLHRRKLEHLQQLKKGLLQQMFI